MPDMKDLLGQVKGQVDKAVDTGTQKAKDFAEEKIGKQETVEKVIDQAGDQIEQVAYDTIDRLSKEK